MALTLRNILQGSASAGTDALSVAGKLFDNAFKGFTGAAQTVQEGRQARFQEESDANTRALLSELRGVTDEGQAARLQTNFLDQATARYGNKFDAAQVDSALQALKGNIRQTKESDYQYGQSQLQRGLTGTPVGGDIESIRTGVAGIEEQLLNVDPADRSKVRSRLLRESQIDADRYLNSLTAALPEGSRSAADYEAVIRNDPTAQALGIDADKLIDWSNKRRTLSGEAKAAAIKEERERIKFEAAVKAAVEAGKEVPDSERLGYIMSSIQPLVGERWSDVGTKDRETLNGMLQTWINMGLTNEQIIDIAGTHGRALSGGFGIGGGPDLEAMSKQAEEYRDANIKAAQEKLKAAGIQ